MSSQKRTESMSGGARRASVEELSAPTSEMKMSRRGIAAAIPTEMQMDHLAWLKCRNSKLFKYMYMLGKWFWLQFCCLGVTIRAVWIPQNVDEMINCQSENNASFDSLLIPTPVPIPDNLLKTAEEPESRFFRNRNRLSSSQNNILKLL